MPPRLPPVGDDTLMRLLDLYRHTDPVFAGVIEERIGIAAIAHAGGMDVKPADGSPAVQTGGITQVRTYFAEAAGAAAKFLARPDGPRVGALAFDGWDTHINEGAVKGRLGDLLGALDGAIAALETNMGEAWRDTVVALVTGVLGTVTLSGTSTLASLFSDAAGAIPLPNPTTNNAPLTGIIDQTFPKGDFRAGNGPGL
jgi:uncharacterized protein (DUF1501 family)